LPRPLTGYKFLAYQYLAGLLFPYMRHRTHRLLLILLTLALAVAPLRGAWAAADISPVTASDGSAHCAQMQHGTPEQADTQTARDTIIKDSGPCTHDCDGSCCDGACNACVHVTPAIPDNTILLSGSTAGTPGTTPPQLFPERPAIPLLHPPASSRS
jgi:hypothetical protein